MFLFLIVAELWLLVRVFTPIANFASKRFNISQFWLARACLAVTTLTLLPLVLIIVAELTTPKHRSWIIIFALSWCIIFIVMRTKTVLRLIKRRERSPPPDSQTVFFSSEPLGQRFLALLLFTFISLVGVKDLTDACLWASWSFTFFASYFIDVATPPKFKKWFTLPSLSFGEALPHGV